MQDMPEARPLKYCEIDHSHETFAQAHPYVVRTDRGVYDSRFTNIPAALKHAEAIGGTVDADSDVIRAAEHYLLGQR